MHVFAIIPLDQSIVFFRCQVSACMPASPPEQNFARPPFLSFEGASRHQAHARKTCVVVRYDRNYVAICDTSLGCFVRTTPLSERQ